jgi:hypothetical protein
MVDAVDKDGYQLWSRLDGKAAYRLMDGLISKNLLKEMFFVGDRVELLKKFSKKLLSSSSGSELFIENVKYHERYYERVSAVFQDLSLIMGFVNNPKIMSSEEVDDFWATTVIPFCKILYDYWGSCVTRSWYLHVLYNHLPHQLKRYGTISPFNCSAQERMNGQHSHQIVSSVQVHNTSLQLLKRKRREINFTFIDPEKKREKRMYKKNRANSCRPRSQTSKKTITLDTYTNTLNKTITASKRRKKMMNKN